MIIICFCSLNANDEDLTHFVQSAPVFLSASPGLLCYLSTEELLKEDNNSFGEII